MLNITELTLNFKHQAFTVPSGRGSITLGFSECKRRTQAIADHYERQDLAPTEYGTAIAYFEYVKAVNYAEAEYRRTGQPCPVDLNTQLEGLEGRKVEAVTHNGERREFWVARSTGWRPSHLEASEPGAKAGTVCPREYRSVTVIN